MSGSKNGCYFISDKDPTPAAMAEQIERLLVGDYSPWDVDDFEMQPSKTQR